MTPQEASNQEPLRAAWLCASVCAALLFAFTHKDASTNPASRVATIDSLVHEHTWMINNSRWGNTVDRVVINGESYSSKPPMYTAIGTATYWLLSNTTALTLRGDDAQRDATVYTLTLLIAGLPQLLLLAYGYRFVRWFSPSPGASTWTLACLGMGWLGLAYSTTINNHVPAAVAAFIAFYYAYGLRHRHLQGRRYYVYAGLWGGIAPPLDLGAMFLSAAMGLYLLSHDWKSTLRYLVPAALVPIVIHFGLTWAVSGSLMPIYLQKKLYDYPGSYWRAPTGIDALDEPRWLYLYNITFGHHGFFSMTPVLIFAVFAMIRVLVTRDRTYRNEVLAIGGPLLAMFVFYTVTTKNYGGVCAGFRWLMPAVPLTLLFVAVWFEKARSRVLVSLFFVSLAIGQYNTYAALRDPWQTADWHRLLEPSERNK